MSRSYRKPWIKDRNPRMKRYANGVIRKSKNMPNGKAYRKFTNPWSICDFRFPARLTSRRDMDEESKAWRLNNYKKWSRK